MALSKKLAIAGLETAWLQATKSLGAPPSQDAKPPNSTAGGLCGHSEIPVFLPASMLGHRGHRWQSAGNVETSVFDPDGRANEG